MKLASKIATHYGIINDGMLVEEITKEDLFGKCTERIELQTNNVDKAATILETMGINNYRVIDSSVIRIYEQLENISKINKKLVNKNVNVLSITKNSESLEDYFISHTENTFNNSKKGRE